MTIEVIYISCICVLSVLSIFLGYKLYQFSILILNTETAIEECLDILEEKYKRMNEIIQKPVFFDSIEVRQMISDIKDCQSSVITVANKLTRETGITSEAEKEDK